MACVSMVFYSIFLNVPPSPPFHAKATNNCSNCDIYCIKIINITKIFDDVKSVINWLAIYENMTSLTLAIMMIPKIIVTCKSITITFVNFAIIGSLKYTYIIVFLNSNKYSTVIL